jgi:hypothetical protein
MMTSPAALAVRDHGLSLTFGSAGSDSGQLNLRAPTAEEFAGSGVAVNETTHNVYVADTNSQRLDEFSAAGGFVRAWGFGVDGGVGFETCTLVCRAGTSGSGPGQFTTPVFVAVDNSGDASRGDVYVADTGDNLVQKFDAEGGLIESWGVEGQLNGSGASGGPFTEIAGMTVDGNGNLYVWNHVAFEEPGHIFEFDQEGAATTTIPVPGILTEGIGIGVDNTGKFYLVGSLGNLEKREQTGEDAFAIDAPNSSRDRGFGIDQASNEIYINGQGAAIRHYDSSCTPGPEPCAASDSFGEGILTGAAGVAVDSSNQTVYVADVGHQRVAAFLPGPDVITGPAQGVQATGATLSGDVNPEGGEVTECHFEYGTDTSYGSSTRCASAPTSGNAPVPVHAEVNDLTPGVTYHFRLHADSAACAACKSNGADATFSTPPTPSISDPVAKDLTLSSADLQAKINPHGFHTEYRLEWGTSSAYGNNSSLGDAGEGTSARTVALHLAGLSADTTYHWRLHATNTNGTTTIGDQTFIYSTGGTGLPDHRAYEMVTPSQKNGSVVGGVLTLFAPPPQVAADGARVIAPVIQCFAAAQSCTANRGSIGSPYAFSRTAGSWQTTALAPSATRLPVNSQLNYDGESGGALFAAPSGQGREDFYARLPDGSLSNVGPLSTPGYPATTPHLGQVYASRDLSVVAWEGITDRGQIWPFDGTRTTSNNSTAYQYAGADHSQPLMVGVSGGAGSTDLISTCGTELARAPGTLSGDGRTVYFLTQGKARNEVSCEGAEPPVDELYARIDNGQADAHTAPISQPQALAPQPNDGCTTLACRKNTENSSNGMDNWRDAQLYGASADGSKAFFASTQQLLDSASQDPNASDTAFADNCRAATGPNGCNLYEYDFARPPGRRLIDVSAGDTSGGGPRVQGSLGVSADGSHIYFVAQGVLTSTANTRGQSAQDGADNLYVFEQDGAHEEGHAVFIATMSPADLAEWREQSARAANVTPDGRFVVFRSRAQLTGDDTSMSGAAQVFRYDAESGELVRISVGNEGFNNNGNRSDPTSCDPLKGLCSEDAWVAPTHVVEPLGGGRRDPTMSDDGAYVFFQSPVALTAGALDDVQVATEGALPIYAQNVYEYHEGHVYLISDGRDVSANHAQSSTCGAQESFSATCLLGSDASGSNVFFSTTDRLVSSDTDTELDYYDARICTSSDPCIDSRRASADCQEDACQGSPSIPSSPPSPASLAFSGPGNASAGARPVPVHGNVRVLNHTAHGSRFTLSVSGNTAGRISVSGSGIRAAHSTLAHAGTSRLKVSLSPKARNALRSRRHRVALSLRVTFTPTGGAPVETSVALRVRP